MRRTVLVFDRYFDTPCDELEMDDAEGTTLPVGPGPWEIVIEKGKPIIRTEGLKRPLLGYSVRWKKAEARS